MIAWLDLAAQGEAEVVTSPMTLVEAYGGSTTEQRWDWVLSRLKVADIGMDGEPSILVATATYRCGVLLAPRLRTDRVLRPGPYPRADDIRVAMSTC
ncbi:hypothetical protein GCM10015535_66660 [Streptomyces gelaticus]|uniref:Uncharacterized protein n=2 Tax=Streptomyces gelaticus TaxID=285446 RepID=A0ABQ2W9F4_9ACTN|nr:hypothetical protein GCM10015535_66660 [Streptomyces gelaticus]